jgi:hypothetical protein
VSASSTSTSSGGVDVQTLVITAVASACAAYVTSEIWAPGTLASAAITPVIVALVKEALAKPADAVTRAVPVRGVVRSAGRPGEPAAAYETYEPVQPVEPLPAEQRVPQPGELPGRSRPITGRAWRMAVVTGLLGFVIAAVIITVPEFVAGSSATGGDRQTTFFGGDRNTSQDKPSTTTTTTTQEEGEGTPPASTVTVPPVETTTVPPADTTTVPPAETEPPPPPPPAQTTPAPPAAP